MFFSRFHSNCLSCLHTIFQFSKFLSSLQIQILLLICLIQAIAYVDITPINCLWCGLLPFVSVRCRSWADAYTIFVSPSSPFRFRMKKRQFCQNCEKDFSWIEIARFCSFRNCQTTTRKMSSSFRQKMTKNCLIERFHLNWNEGVEIW